MEWDELQKIREFISHKSLALMKQEKRGSATTGVLLENYMKYHVGGRTFYSVESNVFKHLIEKIYLEVHQQFPEKFGTNKANDVIEALYLTRPLPFFDLQRYGEFLQYEQFAYLFELANGQVSEKVLRLELFRKFDINKKGHPEFTGGLMHVLKHFSVKGTNLSIGKDVNDISGPLDLIELVIRAFFLTEGRFNMPEEFVSLITLNKKYNLKFVFYLEENTKVFFLKTIFKVAKA